MVLSICCKRFHPDGHTSLSTNVEASSTRTKFRPLQPIPLDPASLQLLCPAQLRHSPCSGNPTMCLITSAPSARLSINILLSLSPHAVPKRRRERRGIAASGCGKGRKRLDAGLACLRCRRIQGQEVACSCAMAFSEGRWWAERRGSRHLATEGPGDRQVVTAVGRWSGLRLSSPESRTGGCLPDSLGTLRIASLSDLWADIW